MAAPDSLLVRNLSSVGDLNGPSAILVDEGRVAALDDEAESGARSRSPRVLDGTGLIAVPGFIELQLNGIGGSDFTTDPGAMWRVGPELARHGVSAFLPTIVTSPRGTVDSALQAWRAGSAAGGTPVPLGIHVEGPFISPVRFGAHDAALLRSPDLDEIAAWLETGGLRILTLAPELSGALEAVRRVADAGAVASVGHTDADAATARAALDAGARYATHLFNAMPPLLHRAPGAAGALLADDRVALGLIVDGHHLDPLVVKLVAQLAPGRISLVSDAIAALGLPEGRHRLGDQQVVVRDETARLDDGTLAGSVAGLDDCVRGFARITGSPRAAVEAVTTTPARLLGLEGERGALDVGCRADLVLLDADLRIRLTIIGGEVCYEARAGG